MESVSVLNALVYKHLLKVAPNLTGEFKEKFQPISNSFNCPTLEEMVLKLLSNSAAFNQLLVIAPNIAKDFQEKHPIIGSCDISIKNILTQFCREQTLAKQKPEKEKQFATHSKRKSGETIHFLSVSINKPLVKESEKNVSVTDTDKSIDNGGNDAHELCSISESSTYQDLRHHLKENSVVDKIVLHILNENIKISKMNLQHIILAGSQVQRKQHRVPSHIEIGRFSPKDNSIISSNWNKLVTDLNISNPEDVLQMFCKRSSKMAKLKANVLGLYLSQGMEKLRLAADVFYQGETRLSNFVNGKISQTEHEFIMEYVSKNGDSSKTFNEIAKTLNRLFPASLRRHFLRQNKEMTKTGTYTLEENKFCIGEIMKRSNIKTVLEIKNGKEGTVKKETFETIAKQLKRPVHNIVCHWEQTLKPILLQFHAGTLTFDVRRILANHLLDKNIVHTQDVPWAELLQNPQFAGHTKISLNKILGSLIICIQWEKRCKREEVTIQQVADFANKKYSDHNVKTGGKFVAQKLELVAYYKSLLDSSGNDSNVGCL